MAAKIAGDAGCRCSATIVGGAAAEGQALPDVGREWRQRRELCHGSTVPLRCSQGSQSFPVACRSRPEPGPQFLPPAGTRNSFQVSGLEVRRSGHTAGPTHPCLTPAAAFKRNLSQSMAASLRCWEWVGGARTVGQLAAALALTRNLCDHGSMAGQSFAAEKSRKRGSATGDELNFERKGGQRP